jgi:hypothetical protein
MKDTQTATRNPKLESLNSTFAWQLERSEGLVYFRLPVAPNLTCIFTTRSGGVSQGPYENLNFAHGLGDDPESVEANLRLLKQTFSPTGIVTLKQVHSATVLYLNYDKTPPDVFEGDGFFTDQPGVTLAVKVADCLPIYFFSAGIGAGEPTGEGATPAIGLVHAGWRGTRSRIAEQLVLAMQRKLSINPADLHYALGPCISGQCYEVGAEVAEEFKDFPAPEEFLTPVTCDLGRSRFRLDLKAANRQILRQLGLREVADLNKCTHCSPGLFYSARRDKVTGRNLALIGLPNPEVEPRMNAEGEILSPKPEPGLSS